MYFHPDAKLIAKKAWSFRLALLASAGAAVEAGVQAYINGLGLSFWATLGIGLVAAAGAFARVVAQPRSLPDAV